MQDSVSQEIHKAALALLEAVSVSGANIAVSLNSTLSQFLTWPFKADSVHIIDSEGKSITFEAAIYTSSAIQSESQPLEIEADAVACGVHVVQSLGVEELQRGYEHIAGLKRLKRTQMQVGVPLNNAPLGIIFAIDSNIPIEKTAELMMLLNKSRPASEWPDMIAVLTRGTVNYVVQIHGGPIKADFSLPNITEFAVMPMYIHVFARGLGLFSMNRMCGFLFMHLQIFSPGAKLPNINEVLKDVFPLGITLGAYQFNLKHQLVPARNLFWERGSIGPLPFRIEDAKGDLLSHLEFIPWQDGGVVRLIGKLPLEAILVFMGPVSRNAQIIRQPDGAISSVLPIGEAQFKEMLARFQQRSSNMNVRPESPKLTIRKISDEGASSPFTARLFPGIVQLRDGAFTDSKKRQEFDKAYHFVLNTLMDVQETSKEIIQTWTEYSAKVSQGGIVRLKGHVIHVSQSIDGKLRNQVAEFLNSAVRVVKDGTQNLATCLELDIAFLYMKQTAFEKGITALAQTQPELAAYLQETRKWSDPLIQCRNSLHEGWMLPEVTYKETSLTIEAVEPEISGQPLSVFVSYMSDRLCCFVEEVSAYGLQAQMPSGTSITEIPISHRKADSPERFQFTFIHGGMPIWKIAYHVTKFDET
jgi:hypothetical protein